MNTNCLEGMKCPKCGNEGQLNISVLGCAEVTDDGIQSTYDFEWDKDSGCSCPVCFHDGKVSDYQK